MTVSNADTKDYTYIIDLKIDNDTYVVGLKVVYPLFVSTENTIQTSIAAKLLYSTTNKPIFVTISLLIDDITISSSSLGYIMPNSTLSTLLRGIVPPLIAEKIKDTLQPYYAVIRIDAYRNSTHIYKLIKVPIIVMREKPAMVLRALFANNLTYYVAVSGETASIPLKILVSNNGALPLRNVFYEVSLGNMTIASGYLASIIEPGNSAEKHLYMPVPFKDGVYSIDVKATGYSGLDKVTSSTNVILIVIPRIYVSITTLNSTVIEGSNVCFKISTLNMPSYANASIIIEEKYENGWNPVGFLNNISQSVYCTHIPSTGLIAPKVARFRASLLLRIYGIDYVIRSNEVSVNVLPLTSIIRTASLTLVPSDTSIYRNEQLRLNIMLSPSVPTCLPCRIEKYSTKSMSWEALTTTQLCNGRGDVSLTGIDIGEGRATIRATVSIDGVFIISNTVTVMVYGEPRLNVNILPSIVPPNSTLEVIISLEPFLKPYKVSILPSWSNIWVNATASKPVFKTRLAAPEKQGVYTIKILANVDGYRIEKIVQVTVTKLSLTVTVVPETLRIGEVNKIKVKAEIYPGVVNATARIELRGASGIVSANTTRIVNGIGEALLDAPQEPGNYTVVVMVPAYGLEASKSIQALRIIYGITLTLNTTSAPAGSRIAATVTITPPPKEPVTVNILIREKGTQLWKTAASGLAVNGKASIVINAPSTPGTYEVQAVAPQIGAKSNIAVLTVTQAEQPSRTQLMAIIGAVAAAALLWSIRTIRRG
ncbi:hypothetical protein PYJP_15690 [Pyrofollis japonicus]|nr:hypothetical protein PYJP_15690 [Pyrofollis japonicus]